MEPSRLAKSLHHPQPPLPPCRNRRTENPPANQSTHQSLIVQTPNSKLQPKQKGRAPGKREAHRAPRREGARRRRRRGVRIRGPAGRALDVGRVRNTRGSLQRGRWGSRRRKGRGRAARPRNGSCRPRWVPVASGGLWPCGARSPVGPARRRLRVRRAGGSSRGGREAARGRVGGTRRGSGRRVPLRAAPRLGARAPILFFLRIF